MRCFTPGVFLAILAAACQQQSAAGPVDGQGRDGGADGLVLYMPAGCPPTLATNSALASRAARLATSAQATTCVAPVVILASPCRSTCPCFCTNATPAAAVRPIQTVGATQPAVPSRCDHRLPTRRLPGPAISVSLPVVAQPPGLDHGSLDSGTLGEPWQTRARAIRYSRPPGLR